MADVTPMELANGVREAPRAGRSSPTVRRLRDAWQGADAFMRGAAALLLLGDGQPVEILGEALEYDRLPAGLALPVLASAEDWAAVDAAAVPDLATGVIRRLKRAGYSAAGLGALDVVSAAWLPGPPGSDVPLAQVGRVAEILARPRRDAASMLLAQGLAAAAHRAGLRERHGLVLPDQVRHAIGPASLAEVAAESGFGRVDLSRWASGSRRVSPEAALWTLARIESGERLHR